MSRVLPLVLLLLALAPRPGRAEEAPTSGVSLGLRTGYALPFGTFSGEPEADYLYDLYSGLFPLWVDVAYRWPSGLFVGAHAQYAFVQVRGRCPEELKCGGGNVRLGVDVGWRFRASTRWEPWLALGTGYEWTDYTLAAEGGSLEAAYRGPELLSLQAGGDYRVLDGVRVGPFATLTVGQYTHLDVRVLESTGSEVLPRRSPHFWFFFGVRGQLSL
jgi:hypothetical protein